MSSVQHQIVTSSHTEPWKYISCKPIAIFLRAQMCQHMFLFIYGHHFVVITISHGFAVAYKAFCSKNMYSCWQFHRSILCHHYIHRAEINHIFLSSPFFPFFFSEKWLHECDSKNKNKLTNILMLDLNWCNFFSIGLISSYHSMFTLQSPKG